MPYKDIQFLSLALSNAIQTIKAFTTGVVSGNDIILNDKYQVDASNNQVTFTLEFNNIGVATSTDVFLDNVQLANAAHGSLIDFSVDTDINVDGKFLKIFSAIVISTLTPLPDNLEVDFTIKGGIKSVNYPLPVFKLNAVGETVNLDISIFFFHL